MNKEGQFYLLVAIIITIAILAFSSVSNYIDKKSPIKLYDLKEDLEIESAYVLDYGTYNTNNEKGMFNLLKDFTDTYADYAGKERNLYFVFGNYKKIVVVEYSDLASGGVSLDIDDSDLVVSKEDASTSTEFVPKEGQTIIKIMIEDQEYTFKLNPGENFYFVITQEIDGEKHVVTG